MRKSLVLFGLLLVVVTVGGAYCIRQLTRPLSQVTYRETTLAGDRDKAQGLVITKASVYNDHLLWLSKINFLENSLVCKSDCRYSMYSVYSDRKVGDMDEDDEEYLSLYNSCYFERDSEDFAESELEAINRGGIVTATDEDELSYYDYDSVFAQFVKPVIDKTREGESKTERVYLRDVYDYYPIKVGFNIGNCVFDSNSPADVIDLDETQRHYVEVIKDFFRIPILSEEAYDITVEKDENGQLTLLNSQAADKSDQYHLSAESILSEHACYFWFNNWTEKGKLVDTSLIPGGYGIYELPYASKKIKNEDGIEESKTDVFVDELKLFYPVDPDTVILDIVLTKDQAELLLYTHEDGQNKVTIIDAASGQEKETIKLFSSEQANWIQLKQGNENGLEYCESCQDNSLYVIARNMDGNWELAVADDQVASEKPAVYDEYLASDDNFTYEEDEDHSIIRGLACEHKTFYNGEIYVVEYPVTQYSDTGSVRRCNDFILGVYDKNGLAYMGLYQSSLEDANLENANARGHNYFNKILSQEELDQIAWEE